MDDDTKPIDPILRRPEVLRLCGFSDSTLHRLIHQKIDAFPAPVRLGVRARGWRTSEVRQWLASRKVGPSIKAPKKGQSAAALEI
jgi:prophage regulatory protein